MQVLIILLCACVGMFGTWAFLKIIWEPGNTEHLKNQAYIRDLEWQKRQLDAGLNPGGMPFDYDRSHDLCNAYSPCPGCAKVSAENDARVQRDLAIRNKLLGVSNNG